MAKRTEEQRTRSRENLRHPVQWMRGDGLPEDQVRPWELAAHIVPGFFGGFRRIFTNYQHWLWQNVFHLDKGPQTVISTVSAVWDGLNDPIIGSYMDHKNYPSRTNRWIMRVSVIAVNLLTILTIFDWGMSTWQRVALIIAVKCVTDFFGTTGAVSSAKVYAQITPYSAQRTKVVWASKLGDTFTTILGAGFWPIIGMRDILHFSPYQMFVMGAVVFTIPTLFTDLMPSFVLQRVPDPPQKKEKLTFRETVREVKEGFMIMRHNKFFVVNTIARLVAVFTPSISDSDFYRFCGLNETVEQAIEGWAGKGNAELLYAVRNFVTGVPGNALQPMAPRAIKKVGGPRNMMLWYSGANIFFFLLRFIVGVKTIPGILISWGADMVLKAFTKWDQVATGIADFEMLDYVEYKTGRRSEGVKVAVDGLINKIMLNNIDTIVGNMALLRAGFKIELDTKQTPTYVKWATIFYFLSPVIDNSAYFIARLFYNYPAEQRIQVEAELVERRRLAELAIAAEEAEANPA